MRKKIAYQFLVSNIALITNFLLIVILARLMTPEDVGIFSMSAVLVAIAHVFRDFGVSSFLKQEREITPTILSGAIGLLVTSSFGMAAILFISSKFWANFYGEPRVAEVIKVLAVGFAFIPVGAIPQALIIREMDVTKSSLVTLFSTGVYFVASIALAFANFGYMTMAWANLINIILSGIAYNLVLGRSTSWIPSTHHWTRILVFGTGNLFAAIIKAIDNAIPDVILGKFSTPTNVGLYSRANSTSNMIATLINPTIYFFAVPYLAKAHHQQGEIVKDLLRGDSIIICLLLPPLIGVAILAHPIVLLLYGAQWATAAVAIPWLCLSAGVAAMFSVTAYAVTSKGKPYAIVPALLVTVLAKVLSAWLFFDGSLATFAKAIAIGQIVGLPVFIWVNWHYLGVHPIAWLQNVIRPLPVWLSVGASLVIIRHVLPADISPFILLALSGISVIVVTVAGYLLSELAIRGEILIFYNKFFKGNQ